jgi:hypothetical protein
LFLNAHGSPPPVAQEQGISLSDAIRIAMVKYLKENGIDWREEE